MNSPLVSVIIPAYNHEKYVQETIQSIINQSYQNIELLVIDDGSSDNTWQKINELKEICESRFIRTIFETQENQGTCSTLNKLLEKANGEYIYLIASDDKAKAAAIEIEVDFLSKNADYALVVGDNELIDENSRKAFWDKNKNLVYKNGKFKTFAQFLQKAVGFNFKSKYFGDYETLYMGNYIPNGYLIRKSIFEKTGYFTKEAPLEDWYLMLQISKYAKMKYIDKILFSYRWHDSNTIKNTERSIAITQKTFSYENSLLKNIDLTAVSKSTQKICTKILTEPDIEKTVFKSYESEDLNLRNFFLRKRKYPDGTREVRLLNWLKFVYKK